jgi:NAD-dependent deacetylase
MDRKRLPIGDFQLHTDPELLRLLRNSPSICVLSGAGVSAESGVPTFRDALSGLWAKFDPAELATPAAFERDPQLVTRWYDHRRCNVARCRPNPGHVALARLADFLIAQGRRFTLVTQNVDRLHQAAGSRDVIELHGTLWVWQCSRCGRETEERGPAFDVFPPRCHCGGHKRPGVVWFGEALPEDALLAAQRAAQTCELFLSLGTSSIVHPAAGLIDVALENKARLLEINPEQTPYSGRAAGSIRGKTGEVLPRLFEAAFAEG